VATKNYLNFDCRSRIFFFSSPNFLYSQQEWNTYYTRFHVYEIGGFDA
jgi:hypothetical protein